MLGSEFDDLSAAAVFLTQGACDVDTDALVTYVLKNGISKLTGTGSMTSEIFLNHQPMSLNKRFQLGLVTTTTTAPLALVVGSMARFVLNGQSVMLLWRCHRRPLEGVGFETDCGGEFVVYVYLRMLQKASIYVTGASNMTTHMLQRSTTLPHLQPTSLTLGTCGCQL